MPANKGSSPFFPTFYIGVWCSLVAHLLWEQVTGGSNPLTPICIRAIGSAG